MRRRIKPIVVVVFFALCGLFLVIGKAHSDSLQKQQLASAKDSIPTVSSTSTTTTSTSETDENFVLKPIIDISGWQLPSEIDYDTLSQNISGAIVRVYGGSQISKDSNAAYTTGIDKSFKTFLKELKKLGAENVGIYIGTYFMDEQEISVDGFDAVWIPAYGSDTGYYDAAPQTDLDYDLHQYTSQGYINGFSSPLDLNQIAVTKDTKTTYEKLFGTTSTSSSSK